MNDYPIEKDRFVSVGDGIIIKNRPVLPNWTEVLNRARKEETKTNSLKYAGGKSNGR